MSREILITHLIEQLGAQYRDIARQIAVYRKELEDGGVPKDEARELALRLEERLLGPIREEVDDGGELD